MTQEQKRDFIRVAIEDVNHSFYHDKHIDDCLELAELFQLEGAIQIIEGKISEGGIKDLKRFQETLMNTLKPRVDLQNDTN